MLKLKSSKVQGCQAKPLPHLSVSRRQVQSSTLPSVCTGSKLPPSIQALVDKEIERPPVRSQYSHVYKTVTVLLTYQVYIGKRAYRLRANTSIKSHVRKFEKV